MSDDMLKPAGWRARTHEADPEDADAWKVYRHRQNDLHPEDFEQQPLYPPAALQLVAQLLEQLRLMQCLFEAELRLLGDDRVTDLREAITAGELAVTVNRDVPGCGVRPPADKMRPFEWLYWALRDAGMAREAEAMQLLLTMFRGARSDAGFHATRQADLRTENERLAAALRELHGVCVAMDADSRNVPPREEQYRAAMAAAVKVLYQPGPLGSMAQGATGEN